MSRLKDFQFAMGLLRKQPFSALVQVTNRCNMKCGFCAFWSNPAHPRDELTVADYVRLSDQMAELGCFLVSIEGGEPTLRPDLCEIVAAFSRHHLTILYTNGWHVDPDLAARLFAAGLHQVGVSIDYAEAEAQDRSRGLVGGSDRAWQAVTRLRDAAPAGHRVHVMTVLMEENRADWAPLVERSRSLGVDHAFTLLSVDGDRRDAGAQRPPQGPASAELLALYASSRVIVPKAYLRNLDAFLKGDTAKLPACRAGTQSFNIDHLGNLAPCIERIGESVGNLRTEPLSQLLTRLADHPSVAGCQDCWTLCRGVAQSFGGGPDLQTWLELTTRLRV